MLFLRDTFLILLGELAVELPALFVAIQVSSFMSLLTPSKAECARDIDLPALAHGLDAYRSKKGHYPDDLRGLVDLHIMDRVPFDPWAREYFYDKRGGLIRLGSFGKDGAPGGEGNDQDIDCWIGAGRSRDANHRSCWESPPGGR